MRAVVCAIAVGPAACVIPPSLEVGSSDGAVNSPPAITSVSVDLQEIVFPGPMAIDLGSDSLMTVNVLDTDLDDTLYVRAFVDYSPTNELDARSKCVAPPATVDPTAARTTTCDLRSLCVAADVTTPPTSHDLSVVVFDREPLDTVPPNSTAGMFQAMPPGGLSTSVYFHLDCFGS